MNQTLVRTIGIAALAFGVAAVAQAQDRPCHVNDLIGSWAYTETGTIVAPTGTPATVAVGRYTFGPEGTVTAIQWSSTAGQGIGYDTKDGTYTLNDDCTVTMTLNGYRADTKVRESTWQLVLADNGKEMRGISLALRALVPNVGWVALQPVMTMTGTRVRGHQDGQ